MVKKIFFILFLFNVLMLFSQDKELNYRNIKFKKLKSNKVRKEKIVIKKPDIKSWLPRKETIQTYDLKVDIREKIKNSNKLLY